MQTFAPRLFLGPRRIAVAALLCALITLFPLAQAGAADDPTITFNGAGFGHGVGLSQWGAYGRAADPQNPQDYTQILADYFQGSSLETLGEGAPDAGNIFVNSGSDRTATTLTVIAVPGEEAPDIEVVRGPTASEPQAATVSAGDLVVIADTTPSEGHPDGCQVTVRIDGIDNDWGVGSCDVTVGLTRLVDIETAPPFLIGATNCDRANDCEFGYGVAFHTVDNASDQRWVDDTIGPNGLAYPGFDLVIEMDLDEYTLGVKEVYFSWPEESLKAMAVTARSYGAAHAHGSGHESAGCFCDLKTTSASQVYVGYKIGLANYDRWAGAADETKGLVLYHPVAPNGGIITGFHSSSNGGKSESSVDKWVADLPYLVSIEDPWSLVEQNSLRSWSFSYSADYVVDQVWGPNSSNSLTAAEVVETNASGSARAVRFEAEEPDGDLVEVIWTLKSGKIYNSFRSVGQRSWYFSIDDSELGPDEPPPPATSSADVGLQDPRTGIWTLRNADGSQESFYYGDPADYPFIGDWDGNGTETLGLYRRSEGFLFLRNSNTQGVADIDIYYGIPGDIPIAGDWNGDGTDTVGIYRPSDGKFYLRNTNTQGIADIVVPFGQSGDQPLAGDWDGDGVDSVGVYRPSNKTVYLTDSVDTGEVSTVFVYSGTANGDRIIAGDWDNDGDDTLGVFRPSSSTFYLRDTYIQSSANIVFTLGSPWMNPVAGKWGG